MTSFVNRRRFSLLFFLAGLCLILALPLLVLAEGGSSQGKVFPHPPFSPKWVLDEPVKTYTKDNLFNYINGEAELYYPYGFERLASGFYAQQGSNGQIGLAADVYTMGSLLDAFGIYAQYRKPEAEVAARGAEGFINPSQLLFYQDRYFIHLAVSGTAQLEPSVFQACAQALSNILPGGKEKPKELDLLKIPSLLPRTERYYPEGVLGYAFFRRGMTGLAALGDKKFRVFVLMESSPESAAEIIDQYTRYIKESKLTPIIFSDGKEVNLFSADPLHKGIMLRQKGRFVVGAADLEHKAQGTYFVDQLISRLPST
jgi:hypothetical protein